METKKLEEELQKNTTDMSSEEKIAYLHGFRDGLSSARETLSNLYGN